ncbi:hypothetical protein DICVIV_12688 [Dictyocaulus viviparus]|uniref:Transmembrane protein n=1 Tax=Dictyocaulus viviparus TaxID=29172 RepID=A0A0D8XC48_DICVI|nr:hypothetical protein DICVIV_12688 [Dictyocaulus viviparus]
MQKQKNSLLLNTVVFLRKASVLSGDFLNTELDFLYQRARQLATNLPMGETRLVGFQITAEELRGSPLAPNLLPLLMNFRLFGIPLEFFNLFIALIAYASVYPAVFWRVSKLFRRPPIITFVQSDLVSFVTLYNDYSTKCKYESNWVLSGKFSQRQYLVQSRNWPFYHPYVIILSFVTSLVLMTVAPISLYSYGYNKYFSHYYYNRYAPHTIAIVLLVLIVIVRAPTIYALMIFYQHEEKPLLLTCIIVDVVYLFTWILLWLMLTLKREWSFNVAHTVQQIYALQKGLAIGHIKGNENPSQLQNSIIVMQKEHMFITDDQAAKQSLLRHLQRGHFETADESYWSKSNGNDNNSNTRKLQVETSENNTPETPRRSHQLHEESTNMYNSVVKFTLVVRHVHGATSSAQSLLRGNSSTPDGRVQNSGTLERSQNYAYNSTLQRNPASVQRQITTSQWPTQQEAYASIHKFKDYQLSQRRDSDDAPQYGNIEKYSSYSSYGRMLPQSRISIPPTKQQNNIILNNTDYSQQHSNSPSVISVVRQSPLMSERRSLSEHNGANSNFSSTSNRDRSLYQRSAIKLTSFNANDKNIVYGSAPSQWTIQKTPPDQSSQVLWNTNKSSLSASSSQQEHCFTPTSTLTSQGSTCNYDSQTPTARTPPQANAPIYNRTNPGGGGVYGTSDEETTFGNRTLQKPPKAVSSSAIRHAVKVCGPRNDDSANFSLTSSNGSSEANKTSNEFATSIV